MLRVSRAKSVPAHLGFGAQDLDIVPVGPTVNLVSLKTLADYFAACSTCLLYAQLSAHAQLRCSRTRLNAFRTVPAILSPPHTLQAAKALCALHGKHSLSAASAGKNATTARHLLHRSSPRHADDTTTNETASPK